MNNEKLQLKQLDARLKSIWSRSQVLHFTSGLLVFLRWAIPLFLLGVFIDWMTFMPKPQLLGKARRL